MEKTGVLNYRADYLTLSAVGGYGIFTVFSWWLYPQVGWHWAAVLFAIHCACQFILFCIIHNTVHSPVFRKQTWNRALQVYLSLLSGNQVSGFVPGHNLSHHRHLQTAKDTSRTTRARFRWNLLNQVLFFFFMAADIVRMEKRFKQRMREVHPRWWKQFTLESWLVLGMRAVLLLIDWQRALILIILPNLYGIWGLFGTNFWQHDGCDPDHPYNHSRSFTGRLLNLLIFNNGYHGAHHMRPGMHWSLYPQFHEEHLRPNCHPNLDQKSLALYLWRACVWPGRRLDYLGNEVVLPPDQGTADWVRDLKDDGETRSALGAVQW